MKRLLVSSILVTGLAMTGAAGIVSAEQPGDSQSGVHEMEQTQENIHSENFTGEGLEYTVKPGDTLASIAEEHLGSSDKWEVIARANGIETPDQLEAGQTLVIPANADTADAASNDVADQDEDAYTAQDAQDNAMSEEDREMKGEITEISAENESLTLTDENGDIHSLKFNDEELLEGIAVGDFVKVEIEGDGTVISVEKVEKKA
ncbi:MAG: LysM domain-containing protein [Deltaproteobacteria bacterium]